jgi:thiamine-phosphate pyrophosphorylase
MVSARSAAEQAPQSRTSAKMVSARSAAEQAPQSRTSATGVDRLIVFTDREQADRPLVEVVAAVVDGGARLVVLREKDLSDGERAALAAQLYAVLAPAGGRLLLAGRVPGPDGVHLAAADALPVPRPTGLVGRSCHNSAELVRAAADGADYATVSPVFASASKPGYGPQLGVSFFDLFNLFDRPLGLPADALGGGDASANRLPTVPVYALGGVDTPAKAQACVRAGAAGVAVMGAIMRAADPCRVTADLLAAVTP